MAGQEGQEALGGVLFAGGSEVLLDAFWREPRGDCDQGVVSVGRQVREAGGVGGHMLCLVVLAGVAACFGDVEQAVGVGAGADALGGQGLDVGDAAVLEGDGLVQGVEFRVLVVDLGRVRELDGEDADATGSCWTVG